MVVEVKAEVKVLVDEAVAMATAEALVVEAVKVLVDEAVAVLYSEVRVDTVKAS